MLNSIDLNDKSYEELLSEALAQIPLYSDEWTNFNISDPGITVLQNLTAFNILQQEQLSEVTDNIRRGLMRLLGVRPSENVPASLLVRTPEADEEISLPRHFPLKSGSLSFETTAPVTLFPWTVKATYIGRDGEYREVSRLIENPRISVDVFGREPTAGTALYCILDGDIRERSKLNFWVQVPENVRRAPFGRDHHEPVFAKTRWQYFTLEGWMDVEAADMTHSFMSSGEVTLELGELPPALFPETDIYGPAVRCLLCEHAYDTAPRLLTLTSNLFPMRQQSTSAASFIFPGASYVEIHSSLAALGNIFVYCREAGEGDYYAYSELSSSLSQYGRFYRLIFLEDGVRIEFDERAFGFGPSDGGESVLVCCYDNEMIYHRALGPVYGYEEQIIELDLVTSLVPGCFSVLAEIPSDDGTPPVYRRLLPDTDSPDELCYSVLSQEGKLLIRHPAYTGAYTLILADCVSTKGKGGNIRFGTQLSRLGGYDGNEVVQTFFSPSGGFGGVSIETAEELRKKCCALIRGVNTAVTAEDYEIIAKSVPGLAVHKVKAVIIPKENLVNLVVKPYTEKGLPVLSQLYKDQLVAYIDRRRMLTTRVTLISPRYVRIDTAAAIIIKPHYENARTEIENAIRQCLDYVSTDAPFGSWIRFSSVFDTLSKLPCVVRVDSLRLIPEDRADVTISSSDFKLSDRALCYPGDIRLDLSTFFISGR